MEETTLSLAKQGIYPEASMKRLDKGIILFAELSPRGLVRKGWIKETTWNVLPETINAMVSLGWIEEIYRTETTEKRRCIAYELTEKGLSAKQEIIECRTNYVSPWGKHSPLWKSEEYEREGKLADTWTTEERKNRSR